MKLVLLVPMISFLCSYSFANTYNCTLESSRENLSNLSTISGGFDLTKFDLERRVRDQPDKIELSIELLTGDNAKFQIIGKFSNKVLARRNLNRTWWIEDEGNYYLHYGVYNRAKSYQPDFIFKINPRTRDAWMILKSESDVPSKKASFSCN